MTPLSRAIASKPLELGNSLRHPKRDRISENYWHWDIPNVSSTKAISYAIDFEITHVHAMSRTTRPIQKPGTYG